MFKETEKFNKEIIGIDRKPGSITDPKEIDWFIGAVLEELQELKEARAKCDFIGELDAIMDMMYFAAGYMTRSGIDASVSSEIFNAVHDCNMKKARGKKKERMFEHELDAVKSSSWVGPERRIMDILENNYGNK